MNFQEVDREYRDLKQRYDNADLSAEEFDRRLKEMMVQDTQGRWWAKSRTTGGWHYYDGSTWVQGTPPKTTTVQESPPVHKNGGQQRLGGRQRRVIVGALLVVGVIILIVVVALLRSSGSVNFSITDRLDPSETAEDVTVIIDGKNVGTLSVNGNNRAAKLTTSVDSPGKHSYTVSSQVLLPNGRTISGSGQGTIDVSDGKVFEVQYSISGNTLQLTLVDTSSG